MKQPRKIASGNVAVASVLLALCGSIGCKGGSIDAPNRRERAAAKDSICMEPERRRAFFYPSRNRTEFGPDDPAKDGCALVVPDHLFCCPDVKKPTDR